MICRLCLEEKKLIEAHIVARCLHGPLFDPSGPIVKIGKEPERHHPTRIPTGEYDPAILCQTCDNRFSPWEAYAASLLFGQAQRCFEARPNPDYYFIDGIDYRQLKLCLLSILWRMSVSQRPAYKEVRLGFYEDVIREMIRRNDPGDADTLSIAWFHMTGYIGEQSMLGPKRAQQRPVTVYNVGLPGFVAAIKVGKASVPHPLQPMIMKPDKPIMVAVRAFDLDDNWKPTFQKIWRRAGNSHAKTCAAGVRKHVR